MQFDFVPKGKNITGFIKFNSLSVEERLDISDEMVDEAEALSSEDGKIQGKASLKLLKTSLKIAKSHIVEVNLKNTKTNKQYSSYDDLNDDTDMHSVLVTMGTEYMKRVDLKKLLSKQ